MITPFLLFALVSAITPGPNNLLMLNGGLHYGIRPCLQHYIGICVGAAVMIIVVAVIGDAAFQKVPWLSMVMKYLAAVLVLTIAAFIFFSSSAQQKFNVKPFSFTQACLFQWINPKFWATCLAATSLFHVSKSLWYNAELMGLIYFLIDLFAVGFWLVSGNLLKRIVSNPDQMKWINRALAILLALSLAPEFY